VLRRRDPRGYLPLMAAYLFKTEPSEYSYSDLVRHKRVVWEGVSNALALIHLRGVKKGDTIVIYHTGSEKSAVGLAQVSRGAYADPSLEDARHVVVDLKPVRAFKQPVPLAVFKSDSVLRTTELVRISRLSVMPLSDVQLARLLEHANG
jgi:predicted RNA-binding protein with PUA-like domain